MGQLHQPECELHMGLRDKVLRVELGCYRTDQAGHELQSNSAGASSRSLEVAKVNAFLLGMLARYLGIISQVIMVVHGPEIQKNGWWLSHRLAISRLRRSVGLFVVSEHGSTG
jgi:hypothetical protein